MAPDPLSAVLFALDAAKQRATYGAVAGHLGVPAMFLMKDCPRDPLHSWVVNGQTELPSGYPDDAVHLDLLRHARVLRTAEEIAALLRGASA